jgi:hypothetical protein
LLSFLSSLPPSLPPFLRSISIDSKAENICPSSRHGGREGRGGRREGGTEG